MAMRRMASRRDLCLYTTSLSICAQNLVTRPAMRAARFRRRSSSAAASSTFCLAACSKYFSTAVARRLAAAIFILRSHAIASAMRPISSIR